MFSLYYVKIISYNISCIWCSCKFSHGTTTTLIHICVWMNGNPYWTDFIFIQQCMLQLPDGICKSGKKAEYAILWIILIIAF